MITITHGRKINEHLIFDILNRCTINPYNMTILSLIFLFSDFRSKTTTSTNQSNERTTTRKTSTVKKSTTNQTKGNIFFPILNVHT